MDNEGRVVPTKEGVPSDKLSFPLFKLECAAMQSINYVILEEALDLSAIVFKSHKGLQLAPEAYLSRPTHPVIFSMKTVFGDDDPMLAYLKQLESIAKLLGSSVGAVYKNVLLHQWAVEQVAVEYQLEGSKPLRSSKMSLKQAVITLQEKLAPDAIKACDDSVEGRVSRLLRQVYDNVQDCKLGCAPLFAPIPLKIWGIEWDNLEDTAVIQSVLCNE
jgi:hypothetical protein